MKHEIATHRCHAVTSFVALEPVPLSAQAENAPPSATEKPLTPEKNSPGDIPDDQVFIEYRSPGGDLRIQEKT